MDKHTVNYYSSNVYILYDSMFVKFKKEQNEISSNHKFVLEVGRLTQKETIQLLGTTEIFPILTIVVIIPMYTHRSNPIIVILAKRVAPPLNNFKFSFL